MDKIFSVALKVNWFVLAIAASALPSMPTILYSLIVTTVLIVLTDTINIFKVRANTINDIEDELIRFSNGSNERFNILQEALDQLGHTARQHTNKITDHEESIDRLKTVANFKDIN